VQKAARCVGCRCSVDHPLNPRGVVVLDSDDLSGCRAPASRSGAGPCSQSERDPVSLPEA
jgi:hypothetical protein